MANKPEIVSVDSLDIPIEVGRKLKSLGSSVAKLNDEIANLEAIKKAQMKLIIELAVEHDIPNTRLDGVFNLTLCQGKLTLKEQLLLEEGIPASTIESCKERGNPYWQVKRIKSKDE